MYLNYGDRDFFELGILVDTEHSDTVFDMLLCRPYDDQEDLFQFARVQVDIEDSWIDKPAVMSFIGMTEETFDPVQYAIGCTDYYGWENFGADSYGVTYDWRQMTRAQIEDEMKYYLIAWEDGYPEMACGEV